MMEVTDVSEDERDTNGDANQSESGGESNGHGDKGQSDQDDEK